ncbi:hypothetical protein K0M31_000336 [Melipona bicolor]|uniref:Uncharacterized protein n=1 Tax=Melipona bicolor TaxID=60889 RepID=A0AA40GE36_9HYME|nr:hypothetical protein K0M31_000336 [Melipona bicolor]
MRRASDVLQEKATANAKRRNEGLVKTCLVWCTGVVQRRCSKKESERAERETERKQLRLS